MLHCDSAASYFSFFCFLNHALLLPFFASFRVYYFLLVFSSLTEGGGRTMKGVYLMTLSSTKLFSLKY